LGLLPAPKSFFPRPGPSPTATRSAFQSLGAAHRPISLWSRFARSCDLSSTWLLLELDCFHRRVQTIASTRWLRRPRDCGSFPVRPSTKASLGSHGGHLESDASASVASSTRGIGDDC
jgi:hypothetical protein